MVNLIDFRVTSLMNCANCTIGSQYCSPCQCMGIKFYYSDGCGLWTYTLATTAPGITLSDFFFMIHFQTNINNDSRYLIIIDNLSSTKYRRDSHEATEIYHNRFFTHVIQKRSQIHHICRNQWQNIDWLEMNDVHQYLEYSHMHKIHSNPIWNKLFFSKSVITEDVSQFVRTPSWALAYCHSLLQHALPRYLNL